MEQTCPAREEATSELAAKLFALSRDDILRLLAVEAGFLLGDLERAFVAEYVIDKDIKLAAQRAGCKPRRGHYMYKKPVVQQALAEQLIKLEGAALLKAEYIRNYVYGVLEFCPIDYFDLGPDGDWCIDPEAFKQLPQQIKRYVEGVEIRTVGGRKYFKVNFISKASALSMAAKYTLTQHIDVTSHTMAWDDLVKPAVAPEDPVEARIAQLEHRPQGSVRASEPAVAACDVLQAAT